MRLEPKVSIMLDLGDGTPPIPCNGLQEAEFFADLWRAYHADSSALGRVRSTEIHKVAKKTLESVLRGKDTRHNV